MEDAESYAESVSVKSAANMYGGQAIIRRIPTPSSQRRQARNPVPSDSNKSRQHHTSNTAENTAEEMLDTGEDDDDDVLVSPLKINRMEDVEKYDNVADDDQVPTYEQFISGPYIIANSFLMLSPTMSPVLGLRTQLIALIDD